MSAGQVIVGLMLSVTVTVNVHADVFPWLSIAVYVTALAPSIKFVTPEVAVAVNVLTVQLSVGVLGVDHVAVAVQELTIETEIFEGHTGVEGDTKSVTVTVKEHEDVLL
jgi:hypothetical protein